MKLFKKIPKDPSELSELYALKLTIKSAEFPKDIFNIPELQELYVDGNCERIELDHLSFLKLKKLSLNFPSFKGSLTDFFGLPNLENLKIHQIPLVRLSFPIGRALSPLKVLTLKNNSLPELPLEISMLENLEELNLSQNKLKSLPDSIKDLNHLKRLNLDQNEFTSFPEIVFEIPNLTHLSIDGNKFSEQEKERILKEFKLTVY